MDTLPLHPALVHLPLGISFLLPLLGLGLLFAKVRGWLPRQAWVVFVLTSALAFGTAVAAARAGELDEARVKASAGEDAFERHEEAAQAFTLALGAATALSAAILFLRRDLHLHLAMALLSVGYFAVMGLGLVAGHHGGNLVYGSRAAPPAQSSP